MILVRYMKKVLILALVYSLTFFYSFNHLSAEEVDWIEVARTNNQIQFIDANSIKYNNRGFLSVITKYSDISPDDESIISANSYLMAIDCKNRMFSPLPLNGELNQVRSWEEPTNNKLIKKTIINSCSY